MSGPIATAVSAIFGFEASVASFIASIVTGTISGGVQVSYRQNSLKHTS